MLGRLMISERLQWLNLEQSFRTEDRLVGSPSHYTDMPTHHILTLVGEHRGGLHPSGPRPTCGSHDLLWIYSSRSLLIFYFTKAFICLSSFAASSDIDCRLKPSSKLVKFICLVLATCCLARPLQTWTITSLASWNRAAVIPLITILLSAHCFGLADSEEKHPPSICLLLSFYHTQMQETQHETYLVSGRGCSHFQIIPYQIRDSAVSAVGHCTW